MDKQQLEAIRARDAADYPAAEVLRNIRSAGNTDPELEATINMIADRRDLLAAYDTLAARLAEAELSRDSWKREAELNQQAADESANYAAQLAEAERSIDTLLGMIRHQRDVLRECLPYLNESMAGRRPGRSADDIRASVKALTADSASLTQEPKP